MAKFKKCSGECGLEKEEIEENFAWIKKSNKFSGPCRVCVRATKKEYYEKNKDEINKKTKAYYQNHKEEYSAYNKEYGIKNKERIKIQRRGYYLLNTDMIKEKNKKYRENNKEKLLEYRKEYCKKNKQYFENYYKEYNIKNKEKIRFRSKKYKNEVKKFDIIYTLRRRVSNSIYKILKNKKGGESVLKYLPYTMEELKIHIEDQFKEPGNEWMTWDNWGVYDPKTFAENPTWNLDHKMPQSKLPYDSMEHPNFQKCWALSNLRPLSAEQNIKDGNRRE